MGLGEFICLARCLIGPALTCLGYNPPHMNLAELPIDDLVRLVRAGAGLRLEAAGRSTDDLVRLAAAGRAESARVVLRGVSGLPVDDLVRIARAGAGFVSFEDA